VPPTHTRPEMAYATLQRFGPPSQSRTGTSLVPTVFLFSLRPSDHPGSLQSPPPSPSAESRTRVDSLTCCRSDAALSNRSLRGGMDACKCNAQTPLLLALASHSTFLVHVRLSPLACNSRRPIFSTTQRSRQPKVATLAHQKKPLTLTALKAGVANHRNRKATSCDHLLICSANVRPHPTRVPVS